MSNFSQKRARILPIQACQAGFTTGQAKNSGELFRFSMSVLFFKQFLKRPLQIASIVPSSKVLVERVANKIDFASADSEYVLQNIPPMFITVFRKDNMRNGNGAIDPATLFSSAPV